MSEREDNVARGYYNSSDAETFYSTIWGGEDIHVGLYESREEPIKAASHRTVETLAARLPRLGAGQRMLDLGSGYCGASRFLAKRFGVGIDAVNVSDVENERARRLNAEAELADLITVHDGVFESLPVGDGGHAAAWSQDAILHSSDRPAVFREVARALQPGGVFVFSDPMQADDCPEGVLDPILARIHLSSLGSVAAYRAHAEEAGLHVEAFEDHTAQLVNHYAAVRRETDARRGELLEAGISPGYIDRMLVGLGHWVEGGENGHLAWGFLTVIKPS